MKQLNTYIVEKLVINKDITFDIPEDAMHVLSWYKDQKKEAVKIIENWFINEEIEQFIVLICKSNYAVFNEITGFDFNKFKENAFVLTDFNDMSKQCNKYFTNKDWSSYAVYTTPDNEKDKSKIWVDIWQTKGAILITTYYFEILIMKKEE